MNHKLISGPEYLASLAPDLLQREFCGRQKLPVLPIIQALKSLKGTLAEPSYQQYLHYLKPEAETDKDFALMLGTSFKSTYSLDGGE